MIKNGRILQHKNNKTIDFIVNVVRTEKNTMLDFLWEALPLSQNFGGSQLLSNFSSINSLTLLSTKPHNSNFHSLSLSLIDKEIRFSL
jgi:hypothetical protein